MFSKDGSAANGGELGFKGRAELVPEFSSVAFSLTDPKTVSKIVKTEYGYHILKCVTAYDPEEADKNREAIIKVRKQEAFNNIYDGYIQGLNSNLNADLWDTVAYTKTNAITTTSFFDVYDTYFVPVTGASYGTKVY